MAKFLRVDVGAGTAVFEEHLPILRFSAVGL